MRCCVAGGWSVWVCREVRVGVRGVRGGIDANAGPGMWIACNRSARWRGEAKNWPYRPKGVFGLGSRDCIPGWWNWPYRPDSQGRSSELVLPAVIAGSAFCVGLARGDGSTFCRLSTSRLCRFPPAIRGSSDHRLIRFLKNAFFAKRIHCISCQVSIY